MKFKKVYYSVFALADGTIYLTVPNRKPRKSKNCRVPIIDDDGIFRWWFDKADENEVANDKLAVIRAVTLSNALNTRRAIREHIHPRLDEIDVQLRELSMRLEQIEQRMNG